MEKMFPEHDDELSSDKPRIQPLDPALGESAIIDEDIIGMASGDIINRIEVMEKFNKVRNRYQGSFYSDLIFMLTNIRLDEATAREDWQSILKHKHIMSEKLGRNVGIRVATLDYYTNITRQIVSPKIIDMKEYSRTVKESITDPLTFCYNRRYFDYILKQYFLLATEGDQPLSLLMLDLDYFKIYNDHNGHILGDFVLIEVSRIFHVITRKSDIVARYGGEEFVIVLNKTPLSVALETAEKIRHAVEDYRFPNEQTLPGKRLTITIGAAEVDSAMQTSQDLIKRADEALYEAKRSGRNKVLAAEKRGGAHG